MAFYELSDTGIVKCMSLSGNVDGKIHGG